MEEESHVLGQRYRLRFDKNREYRNEVWRLICSEVFSRYVPGDARVLDLGAGWCEFINNIPAGEKYAMDLNAETREHMLPGTHFVQQDCSQEWAIESGVLDVVFASNFLEHLGDKERIERTVAEAYRCLKENGLFICMSPNIRYVLGAYWDFWDHFVPLTDRSCKELLELTGFRVERSFSRFLPYSMSFGKTPPLFLVRIYLRSPFFWRFFGKQFLVIARKNAHGGLGN